MTPTRPVPTVLVTVAGADQPGITSEMTGILGRSGCRIIDIAQAVIHGLLSLSILFEVKDEEDKVVIKDLLFRATEMGLKLEFRAFPALSPGARAAQPRAYRYAITLIAEEVSADSLHQVTRILAKHGLNIDIIEKLSEEEFGCVELIVSSSQDISRRELKTELLTVARQKGVDIALQAEGLYRRAKRMVVFDMDSTLIQNEVIDELAREHGVFEQVSSITERAMKGELEFDESLRLRCEKLKGLSVASIESVHKRIQLTPGADELINVLRRLGYKTALISGGFTIVADRLRERLGIDYAYANQLEIEGGKLTGRVIPPIVNAQRKADLLDVIAMKEGIVRDQIIAVGDGANDLLMLERAGLGVAFNAKPVVRERAEMALNQKNLRTILYLLGISGRDLSELLGR